MHNQLKHQTFKNLNLISDYAGFQNTLNNSKYIKLKKMLLLEDFVYAPQWIKLNVIEFTLCNAIKNYL